MTDLEEFGFICMMIGSIGLVVIVLIALIGKIIEWYDKIPLIKSTTLWNGDRRYYIYRRKYDGQIYDVFNHDWWMYPSTLGTYFVTKEDALNNLPPKPLGFFGKWKKKKEQQKILREREERLKAHKEKMLKVRLDFSDYG